MRHLTNNIDGACDKDDRIRDNAVDLSDATNDEYRVKYQRTKR